MKKSITININSLVENLSVVDVNAKSDDVKKLASLVQKSLLAAITDANKEVVKPNTIDFEINIIERHLNAEPDSNIEIEPSKMLKIIAELKRLQYHEDTTIGLYAIDRKPKKVSYKWIRKQCFRIKKTDNVPLFVS